MRSSISNGMKIWDQSDTYNLIKKYPGQFARGFRLAESVPLSKDIDQVIISAVSYNAATAEIIKNLFEPEISVPIRVHQGYDLPAKMTPKTLVVAISICGKRPEVLWNAKMAHEAGAKVVAVTTGGELEIFARERNLPLILIDKNSPELQLTKGSGLMMPLGAGLMFAILTQVLINAGALNIKARQRILESVTEIENMYLPKLGAKIAGLAADTNLLIYSSEQYLGLASLIKNLVNILAQMPCFHNSITGALGSEIHSFQHKGFAKYFALILRDPTTAEPVQYSIEKLQEKLAVIKLKSYVLELPGSNQLTKVIASIMLTYWVIYGLLDKPK